ncbi:N-acetyltransferase [Rhodobacteraceae bacterium NNCM2]|nr:N-acetyltransferase [Coraliihabitans acroporae]
MTSRTEIALEIAAVSAMADIPAAEWDACAAPECADGGIAIDPFTTHRFLSALEESGSATPQSGWGPHHLVARLGEEAIGVMPLYIKGHSQGEYVFDHAWAHAWERAGGDYYPKLQASVPFTPATGRRLLARPGTPLPEQTIQSALIEGAVTICQRHQLSSLHLTFCTEAEWELGGEIGLLQRTDQQFHWENDGYPDFDAFLAALSSRKRKQIRKERARATENGIRIHALTGDRIEPQHWDAFWQFYQDTGMRKWGRPYLTREFFDLAQAHLRDVILLVLCERDGRWIAGALNFIGRETLFGRYWGCIEDHPCLHFETCYYQAIDYAIAHGLKRVEAGAQGSHKLARGYGPVTTRSLHYLPDPGFREAVARYLVDERAAVDRENSALLEMMPFRKSG